MSGQIPKLLMPDRTSTTSKEGPASKDRVATLKELMSLYDESFVQAAYPLLLGRKADPNGLDYYTSRLRRGFGRVSVIAQLVESKEATEEWDKVPGIRSALKRYYASRRLSGWKLALRDPELGRTPPLKRARALENGLGAQRQALLEAISKLSTQNTRIEQLLFELLETKVASELSQPKSSRPMPEPRPRRIDEIRKADIPSNYCALLDVLQL